MKAIKWLAAFAVVTPLLSHGSVAAQTAFGIKGGVTYADAAFIDQFTSEALLRKVGGGFVTWPLSERATVQLEALYIERGFSTSGLHQDGSSTRMSYLDFPILLRFRPTPNAGRVRPILLGGAYWGHEVACRLEGGVAQFEESNSCEGAVPAARGRGCGPDRRRGPRGADRRRLVRDARSPLPLRGKEPSLGSRIRRREGA